jgi:hypothetical protein
MKKILALVMFSAFVLSQSSFALTPKTKRKPASQASYTIQIQVYERATKDAFEMPEVAGVAKFEYSNQSQETSQSFDATGGTVNFALGAGDAASPLGRLTVYDSAQNQLAYCNDGQLSSLEGWAYRHNRTSIPLIILRTLDNSVRTIVQVDSALPDSPSCDGFPEMPSHVTPVHVVHGTQPSGQ